LGKRNNNKGKQEAPDTNEVSLPTTSQKKKSSGRAVILSGEKEKGEQRERARPFETRR